jgi:hypothetical protein
MLGFYPIASAPIGSAEAETQVYIASQTATLTLSSIALSAGVNRVVDAQSLITTANSPTIQAAANYALNSQTVATTLNSPAISVTANVSVALTSQSISSVIHGTTSLGGDNCAIAALPLCAIPYPDPALEFTGVQTGVSLATTGQTLTLVANSVTISEDVPVLGSQTITTTLNSVSPSASANAPTLASQSLTLTQNSASVEIQPPTVASQSITTTVNSVSIVVSTSLEVASQEIALTLNSVAIELGNSVLLGSQSITSALNPVTVRVGQNIALTGQTINAQLGFVSIGIGQTLLVTSQTLYTTINGLRLWQGVNTTQPTNCSGQPPSWNEIVFSDVIYGDNFAVGATPIADIPRELPPLRRDPPQVWDQIDTTTTTTWDTIET